MGREAPARTAMKPIYYPDTLRRPNRTAVSFRSHALLVALVLLISFAVHMGTFIFCADFTMKQPPELAAARKEAAARHFPAMRADRLPQDPSASHFILPESSAAPSASPALQADQLLEALAPGADTAAANRQTALPTPPSTLFQIDQPPPVAIPTLSLDAQTWQPRQEVKTILDRHTDRELPDRPRWEVAAIERVSNAPDFAAPIDLELPVHEPTAPIPAAPLLPGGVGGGNPFAHLPPAPIPEASATAPTLPPAPPAPSDLLAATGAPAIPLPADTGKTGGTPPEKPVVFQSIDSRLRLALFTYTDPADPQHLYYHLSISRQSDTHLPVIPKDVLFVQDISGSISDLRLEQCKTALQTALYNTLRNEDRFNIIAFRNETTHAFPQWSGITSATMKQADAFIKQLRSFGTTDIFLSLTDILKQPRDPARPVIAVVVTDGEPTAGLLETTRIIGEFTRLNNGAVSVYTFGTYRKLNPYFLDMLCYCNRGFATLVKGNRWDIPAELTPVFESIRNPVMKDLRFTFDTGSSSEVYPRFLTNLYADRTLDLYGRCPAGTAEVACQIRGQTPGDAYDAVFRFTLTGQANRSNQNLRQLWAQRKLFDYLAEIARNPSPELHAALNDHAAQYKLTNPYAKK